MAKTYGRKTINSLVPSVAFKQRTYGQNFDF